jgi:hypothetical protein
MAVVAPDNAKIFPGPVSGKVLTVAAGAVVVVVVAGVWTCAWAEVPLFGFELALAAVWVPKTL